MAIACWQYFFAPNPQDTNAGNYLVFEADRQAEILDWLRCKNIPTAEKDRFIHSLINFDDRCGGFYDFRAYFLAAKYIAVFPNSRFAEEIAEQLLDWSQGNFWCSKSKIDFNKTIDKEAEEALKLTDNSKAIAAHEQTIQNTQEYDLLISTAQKLLELDPQNEIAIATIKEKLVSSNDNNELSDLVGLCDEYKIIKDNAIETATKLLDDKQESLAAHEVAYSLLADEQNHLNLSQKYLGKAIAYLINMLLRDYEFQQAHREHAELVSANGCDINIWRW